MLAIIIFFVLHWYLSLYCQSLFHHRYAAHSQFTMSKFWEKVFYIKSFIFQGSSYLSPRAYGIMHRMHHAYADTEDDPHSPKYDDNLFAMMWRTKKIYTSLFKDDKEAEEKFTEGVPDWESFDKIATNNIVRGLWVLGYIAFYAAFATTWWLWLLLPIQIVMGPFHGVIINWFAHKYGYINYKLRDTSRNLMPLDIFMLGEGYHNNHHKHSGRANFGIKWFEFDPIYPIIKLYDKLGIIRLKPTAVGH